VAEAIRAPAARFAAAPVQGAVEQVQGKGRCPPISGPRAPIWDRAVECEVTIMTGRLKVAGAVVVWVTLSSVGHTQGIPVFDAQNVAQAIATVAQLEQQVRQEIQIYQSTVGTRGFGALLSNPVVANSLPSNWQGVYTAVQNGGYAGLTGSAQTLRSASEIYSCADQTGVDRQICERALNKPFQDKAFGLQAYETELQELKQIQSLMQQIDVTQDPKGVAELQARIQSETVTSFSGC
jgi:type IV secretion system protein VirB5